jgi:hypothetical protein
MMFHLEVSVDAFGYCFKCCPSSSFSFVSSFIKHASTVHSYARNVEHIGYVVVWAFLKLEYASSGVHNLT